MARYAADWYPKSTGLFGRQAHPVFGQHGLHWRKNGGDEGARISLVCYCIQKEYRFAVFPKAPIFAPIFYQAGDNILDFGSLESYSRRALP